MLTVGHAGVSTGCPHNETLRPYGVQLMQTALHVLATDNEENGLLCLRICFDLHKAYRPSLEDQVTPFLDFVRKVILSPRKSPSTN